MKKGTKVKMSAALKAKLKGNSSQHVREFGNCIGIVQGPLDYNNVPPGAPGYDPKKVGPEVNVRWQPSNLRYGYLPEELDVVVS